MIIYLKGIEWQHSGMNNSERRLLNARWLAKLVGGDKQFGDVMDMEPSQVSHIIGENPKRGIGNIIARRIEEKFVKPSGWMDQDHLGATTDINPVQRFAGLYEKGDAKFRSYLESMLDTHEAALSNDRRQEERKRVPDRRAK